jgi:membrane-bound lytic murein transglycosylase B
LKNRVLEFSAFVSQLREQALAAGVSAATADARASESRTARNRRRARSIAGGSGADDRSIRVAPADAILYSHAADKKREHREALAAIAKKYGVSSSVLVAIWGMESNFGRFTGTRPTVPALATLAWEGRRRAFFTTEFINALQILDKGYIELDQMKGSWAGAMGQTQFMPSSYLAHAQDYDGDGRRDIWNTLPDVFASIANYMVRLRMEGRSDLGP